uniref:Uncharacterized protein n=1 Tax=Otarine gammaherpesvirus 4 TaxID=2801541 RepID=A0A889IVY4_9GAMA|nr:hypothetical protein [Otarine gammaherpesvirus 4]
MKNTTATGASSLVPTTEMTNMSKTIVDGQRWNSLTTTLSMKWTNNSTNTSVRMNDAPTTTPWLLWCLPQPSHTTVVIGTTVQVAFLLLLAALIFTFGRKIGFKPTVRTWMQCSCAVYMIWVCGQLVWDWGVFDLKCLVSDMLLIASSTTQSLIQVGMCIDRCRAVHVRRLGGNWSTTTVYSFITGSCIVGVAAAALNAFELATRYPSWICASTTQSNVRHIRLALTGAFYLCCMLITVTLTTLTTHRIMSSSLIAKREIAKTLIMVCSTTTTCWLLLIVFALAQAMSTSTECSGNALSSYLAYCAPAPALFLIWVYVKASRTTREVMRSSFRRSTVSIDMGPKPPKR